MSKSIFQAQTWTPAATADTTNLVDATHMYVEPGAATQIVKIWEIYLGGQAIVTSPTFMQFARASTKAATPTALAAPNSNGPMNNSAQALSTVPVCCVAATTKPQRSVTTTNARLNLNYNAYGGIVKWNPIQDEEWWLIGTTADVGPSVLSAYTGGTVGACGSHIVYEVM
jgi:hypothetical protein